MTAFQPDILITTPDGQVMVIEAKVTMNDLPRTEEALKRYMVGMQFPYGLLITARKGWVYQDLYSSLSPDSVKQVEEFDSSVLWSEPPPDSPLRFEAYVQRWIEALADYPTELLPPKLKEIIQEYVLPAVSIGEVRAAHPR